MFVSILCFLLLVRYHHCPLCHHCLRNPPPPQPSSSPPPPPLPPPFSLRPPPPHCYPDAFDHLVFILVLSYLKKNLILIHWRCKIYLHKHPMIGHYILK